MAEALPILTYFKHDSEQVFKSKIHILVGRVQAWKKLRATEICVKVKGQ